MKDSKKATGKPGPLAGIRVLELGQAIAGPFAAAFLAWFGAEVIKVEPPGIGDPLRNWRVVHEGTSLWWYSMARNKKCVTLNLRVPEGQTHRARAGETRRMWCWRIFARARWKSGDWATKS